MGEATTPRIHSDIEFPGEGAGAATAPPPTPVPQPMRSVGVADPLSRPYTLPSRGLYYGEALPGGSVVISPTRGAQEEILAGAKEGGSGLAALRHVAGQCIDTKGLPFNDLLLFDFAAVMFHFLALSNGTDELTVTPTHPACGKSFRKIIPLTRLACTTLRLAEQGEDPNWPPKLSEDGDEDPMSVIADMDSADDDDGPVDYALAAADVTEPFITDPLSHTGDVMGWRYHRVGDLVKAEEFTARTKQSSGTLHSFLLAAQIVSINGRPVTGMLEAMTWVKNQPTPILNDLRDDMHARNFGYDVTPKFRCPHCGASFKGRLPIDGALFRRRRRR